MEKNARVEQEKLKHEKALFDFEDGVDELETIADRYPPVPVETVKPEKNNVFEHEAIKEFAVKRTERPNFDPAILADL